MELLGKADLVIEALMGPPDRNDPEAVSYCPQCQVEYLEGFDTCADCRIGLKRFDP